MESLSLEKVYELWNDKTGEKYEIGPDRFGLDKIEIRYYVEAGKEIISQLTLSHDEARLLVKALNELIGPVMS